MGGHSHPCNAYVLPTDNSAWPTMDQHNSNRSTVTSRANGSQEASEASGKRALGNPKPRQNRPKIIAKEALKRSLGTDVSSALQAAVQGNLNLRTDSVPEIETEVVSPGARTQDEIQHPHELLPSTLSNSFDCASLPTDARSSFYLHHCESPSHSNQSDAAAVLRVYSIR